MGWWPILAVATVLGAWAFLRTRALFVLSVRDGRVLVVQGRIPGRLLGEFRDVVSRPPIRRATIRGWADEGGGHLEASGVDEGTAQRLRNVFRLFPLAQLRHAPPIARPTLGQLLGIAWLAWLFERAADDAR